MFDFTGRIKKQLHTYKNLGFDTPARSKFRHIVSVVLCVFSLLMLLPAGIHLILDSLIHLLSAGMSILTYNFAEAVR
jgi:hypothetical protein